MKHTLHIILVFIILGLSYTLYQEQDKNYDLQSQLEITRKISYKTYTTGYLHGCLETVHFMCYNYADCIKVSIEEMEQYCINKAEGL